MNQGYDDDDDDQRDFKLCHSLDRDGMTPFNKFDGVT